MSVLSRCEDDFNLISTIFTDIVYNTIYNISISKAETTPNILFEDIYISTLNQFTNEIKKYTTFKKIIMQFMNNTQIHTSYKNVGYDSSIHRLFEHFILNKDKEYTFEEKVKFLTVLFSNVYIKFIKQIMNKYTKIILFDRSNIKYHKELLELFYTLLFDEKKLLQMTIKPEYNSKINVINLLNDFSAIKERYIVLQKENEQLKNELTKFGEIDNSCNCENYKIQIENLKGLIKKLELHNINNKQQLSEISTQTDSNLTTEIKKKEISKNIETIIERKQSSKPLKSKKNIIENNIEPLVEIKSDIDSVKDEISQKNLFLSDSSDDSSESDISSDDENILTKKNIMFKN